MQTICRFRNENGYQCKISPCVKRMNYLSYFFGNAAIGVFIKVTILLGIELGQEMLTTKTRKLMAACLHYFKALSVFSIMQRYRVKLTSTYQSRIVTNKSL